MIIYACVSVLILQVKFCTVFLTGIFESKCLKVIPLALTPFFSLFFPRYPGSRPESSEGEAPVFPGVGVSNAAAAALLDPAAINLIPPEFESGSRGHAHAQAQARTLGLEELQLHMSMASIGAPKGSLV